MEWIVIEADTLETAKELALDRLGVDEREAEFETLAQPSSGLLGLRRGKAQIRARVAPRPQPERERGRSSKQSKDGHSSSRRAGRSPKGGNQKRRPKPPESPEISKTVHRAKEASKEGKSMHDKSDDSVMLDDEQENIARSFVEGTVRQFAPQAEVELVNKKGTLFVRVEGEDLGLLIGQDGSALAALEELLHVCIRRRARGRRFARVRLDIGGYRQLRRERLEDFTRRTAEDVLHTGEAVSFEPMGSLDRKTVHDVALKIDGVQTHSEGEDPRRRVVMSPVE